VTRRGRRFKSRKRLSALVAANSRSQYWWERRASPASWLHTAGLLKACAELIGKPFTDDLLTEIPPGGGRSEDAPPKLFGPVFHLLAGYAFEALLKGILVSRHPETLKGGQLPQWLTHHKLEDLVTKVGVTLQRDQLAFIRRVNVAVVWAGRYPVPKGHTEMDNVAASSSDLDWFQEIYELLALLLQHEIQQEQWRS